MIDMKIQLIASIVLIIVAYGQGRNSLVIDEQLYDNGNFKHKSFYKDVFAIGK